jgi:hypothetical protein
MPSRVVVRRSAARSERVMRTSKAKVMGWSCCAGASGVRSKRVVAAIRRRAGMGEIVVR